MTWSDERTSTGWCLIVRDHTEGPRVFCRTIANASRRWPPQLSVAARSVAERIVRPDGSVRKLDTLGGAGRAHGRPVSLIGTCRDVTDDPRVRAACAGGRIAGVEMLATGAPVSLSGLVRLVEEMAPGVHARSR